MALRVLLADESATIKKVIQLTLQDFAVELKTVNLGVDVLQVAQAFKPDIVLIDILLQKLNGYEVCKQIKTTPELANTPIVLMWSGFMSIDEAQFQAVGADAKLEKPFDAQSLRELVSSLVPKLQQNQDFHQFIDVPDVPTEEVATAVPPQSQAQQETLQPPPVFDPDNQPTRSWDMESFDSMPGAEEVLPDIESNFDNESLSASQEPGEDFQMQSLTQESSFNPNNVLPQNEDTEDAGDESWVNESISKFKLDIPDLDDNSDAPMELEEIKDTSFLWKPEDSQVNIVNEVKEAEENPEDFSQSGLSDLELTNSTRDKQSLHQQETMRSKPQTSPQTLDAKQIEDLVRQEALKIIEEVVWKVVPELANTIIQKEIERLTKDAEL